MWNPAACNYENGKYFYNIMDDSAIMCDEITESYDDKTNFNEKKQPVKRKIFIYYLHFY